MHIWLGEQIGDEEDAFDAVGGIMKVIDELTAGLDPGDPTSLSMLQYGLMNHKEFRELYFRPLLCLLRWNFFV